MQEGQPRPQAHGVKLGTKMSKIYPGSYIARVELYYNTVGVKMITWMPFDP